MHNKSKSRYKKHLSKKRKESLNNRYSVKELANKKKAISQYSYVMIGHRVPVYYNTPSFSQYGRDNTNKTEGNYIVIGNDLHGKAYKRSVGTALHEASHIAKTDFSVVKSHVESFDQVFPYRLFSKAADKGESKEWVKYCTKILLNIIEDRRIDQWAWDTRPGYRKFYKALYKHYWGSDYIREELESKNRRSEKWRDYLFRITNLSNKGTDLSALNGLKQIADIIDLDNISRLKNTFEVYQKSLSVFEVILDNVVEPQEFNKKEDTDSKKGKSKKKKKKDSSENKKSKDQKKGEKGEKEKDNSSKGPSDKAEKKFKEQINKILGNDKKSKISNNKTKEINKLIESNTEEKDVGQVKETKCIVVKNIDNSIIESNKFRNISKSAKHKNEVETGIRMGRRLGDRLQVRDERRKNTTTRKRRGNLDQRLISEIGYSSKIFKRTEIEEYDDAFIHISIDASSSMKKKGKWKNALTMAVTIAKACDIMDSIECQISVRSTVGFLESNSKALMIIAYDSQKDHFNKAKRHLSHLTASGATPEGLCFEAILENIETASRGKDSYFINISDGMPYFSGSYKGQTARNHTKKQVEKIKNANISVLSYFIKSNDSGKLESFFKQMYGANSQFIDVSSVNEISQTMNNKFLEKR